MFNDTEPPLGGDTAKLSLILELATKLWGTKTTSHQSFEHWFGNRVVNIQSGAWFDFDADEGGYLRDLMKKAEVASRAAESPAPTQHWHGESDPRENIKWLIQDLLPETGFGLLSAQWGMYKTFIALDIGASAMTGQPFLCFATRRKGGVMFIAAEGANTIGIRLAAVVEEKCGNAERMPFTWLDACPLLIDSSAVDKLVKDATETNARMMSEFGIPLVLIVIDTIAVAAGYQERGDENDSSIGAKITATMANLAKRTGTFVLGVDHFGKAIETGTRGTSTKETNPDVILAVLGERTVTGKTKNTRLALRKRRTGENGEEFAFRPRIVDLGVDENGSTITSVVIEWQSDNQHDSQSSPWETTRTLRSLKTALTNAIQKSGFEIMPAGATIPVQAVSLKALREEFRAVYVPSSEDDQEKRANALKSAINWALRKAVDQNLITIQEHGAYQIVWAKQEAM
jgi:hypothetical protein